MGGSGQPLLNLDRSFAGEGPGLHPRGLGVDAGGPGWLTAVGASRVASWTYLPQIFPFLGEVFVKARDHPPDNGRRNEGGNLSY
jgi:hypothetical protein